MGRLAVVMFMLYAMPALVWGAEGSAVLETAEDSPRGRIVIVNGTSSCGKTTLCQQAAARSQGSWSYISLDDTGNSEDDDDDDEESAQEELLKHAKHRAKRGEQLICDTVLLGNDIERAVKKLRREGFDAEAVLVYCPLPTTLERVKNRNSKALTSNTLAESRLHCRRPMAPVQQFCEIYRQVDKKAATKIGTISRDDLLQVTKILKEPYPTFVGKKTVKHIALPHREIDRLSWALHHDFGLLEEGEPEQAIAPFVADLYKHIVYSAQGDAVAEFLLYLTGRHQSPNAYNNLDPRPLGSSHGEPSAIQLSAGVPNANEPD